MTNSQAADEDDHAAPGGLGPHMQTGLVSCRCLSSAGTTDVYHLHGALLCARPCVESTLCTASVGELLHDSLRQATTLFPSLTGKLGHRQVNLPDATQQMRLTRICYVSSCNTGPADPQNRVNLAEHTG